MRSQTQIDERQSKTAAVKKPCGDFVTSPVGDFQIRNALHERELRPYLKKRQNFNVLVNAGILLSDGRIVCSTEQWNETRDNILNKLQKSINGRSHSLPEEKIGGLNGQGEAPIGSPRRRPKSATVSLRQYLENLRDDIESDSSDELWGSMSSPHGQGTSRGRGLRRGSGSSRSNITRNSSHAVNEPSSSRLTTGKSPVTSAVRGAGASPLRRASRDQEAFNKERINQQNRDERSKNSSQSAGKDDPIFKMFEKSQEILETMNDNEKGRILKAIKNVSASDKQLQNIDINRIDTLILDLSKRQDKLFRALGERCIKDVTGFLNTVPKVIEADHAAIFNAYAPNVQLLKLASDLTNKMITEEDFFKEAARLVKLMNPTQIIEHLERMLSKSPPRRLLRVTSDATKGKRYEISWPGERPSQDAAAAEAAQVVHSAMEHASGLLAKLAEKDGAILKQLAIGSSDASAVGHRRVKVDDLNVEVFANEHVTFDEHDPLVCPRPLEPGQSATDLKPVTDRPPTPIPSSERVRRKSGERVVLSKTPAEHKQKSREIAQAIRQDCEKRLRRRMKHDGWKTYKSTSAEAATSDRPPVNSEQIKERVLERLGEWKALEKERNRLLTRVVESISDLIPHVAGEQREKFVRNISKQVSSIVGTTLREARDIMFEALNLSRTQLAQADEFYDSDDIGSVSSTIISEQVKKPDNADKKPQEQQPPKDKAPEPEKSEDKEKKIEFEDEPKYIDDKPETEDGEPPGEDGQPSTSEHKDKKKETFHPVFGDDDLNLGKTVMTGSLAAFSVRHDPDSGHTGHEGHEHAPPVSHMKEFFKSRRSMPTVETQTRVRADPKRHTMPAVLPECMDPNKMHGRHSFLSVLKPDLQMLPEYRDKTKRQVETVLQDHSVFGRLQGGPSPAASEEAVIASEDLGRTDEEIAPKFQREKLPPAAPQAEQEEMQDAVPDLAPGRLSPRADQPAPRAVASTPTAAGRERRRPGDTSDLRDPFDDWDDSPAPKTQSLTASRMVLRCDSDPRLSLRESSAEVTVDIHHHDEHCEHHEAHDEPESELNKLESSALGFAAERTCSDSKVAKAESVSTARRSGSADGGPIDHPDADSDDEMELRVRNPEDESGTHHPFQLRYY